jgi:hypothetical protein
MPNCDLPTRHPAIGVAVALISAWIVTVARAPAKTQPPLTNVIVVVTDAPTGKPVFQARLTLEFRDPESRRGKFISFNAKTNLQGKYRFTFIPLGPVLLMVTDPDHQSFGHQYRISQQNQVLRVTLRRPQPLR